MIRPVIFLLGITVVFAASINNEAPYGRPEDDDGYVMVDDHGNSRTGDHAIIKRDTTLVDTREKLDTDIHHRVKRTFKSTLKKGKDTTNQKMTYNPENADGSDDENKYESHSKLGTGEFNINMNG